jgi:hypothetical protein
MVLRDMAGQVTTLKAADVEHEEHLPTSMMPPGLANALSLTDRNSLFQGVPIGASVLPGLRGCTKAHRPR